MNEKYNLTKDQLDFISFMKRETSSQPNLNERLEKYLIDLPTTEPVINEKKISDNTTRHHNPKGVIKFLRLFSIDDTLKWFTHKWDNNSEELNLSNLFRNFSSNLNKLRTFSFGDANQGIPAKLFYNVINFVRPDKLSDYPVYDQSGKKFDATWADVKEWAEMNPGVWPAPFITLSGQSFETTVHHFKQTIEFRTDGSLKERFNSQIRELIKTYIVGAVNVEFTKGFRELGRNLNIYCNVNSLFAGIKNICDWVASYKIKGDTLIVDLQNFDTFYQLTLFHKGSYFSGNLDKFNGLSGNFKTLRENLFSVCDLSMEGKLDGRCIKVTALDKDTEMSGANITTPTKIIESDDTIDGVLYTLKLYK